MAERALDSLQEGGLDLLFIVYSSMTTPLRVAGPLLRAPGVVRRCLRGNSTQLLLLVLFARFKKWSSIRSERRKIEKYREGRGDASGRKNFSIMDFWQLSLYSDS